MQYTPDGPIHGSCAWRTSRRWAAGFTLVELLVVIGIIVLLISIAIPALSTARESSRRAVCASNMRQLAQGMFAYATDHDGALPVHHGGPGPANVSTPTGQELWDLAKPTRNVILGSTTPYANDAATTHTQPEARRRIFYCPSNPDRESDPNWYNDAGGQPHAFSQTGYSFLVQRDLSQPPAPGGFMSPKWLPPPAPSLLVSTLHEPQPLNPATPNAPIDNSPSARALITDIVAGNAATYDLRNPSSSSMFGSSTNHMKGSAPAGGNICFLDGHVEWRAFSEMNVPAGTSLVTARCSDQPGAVFFFW